MRQRTASASPPTTKVRYRDEARRRLAAATREMLAADDDRLRYAALELRMAMEALTYDRAVAYKDEFPPAEYSTWQPRRVMTTLLELDEAADSDTSVSVGLQPAPGVPAPIMEPLGTERVLSMDALREHYDALGSYLHLPTVRQSAQGGADLNRLRTRCERLIAVLEAVLASPVYNVVHGALASFNCTRCNAPVRKRLPRDGSETVGECYGCHATYTLRRLESGSIEGRRRLHDINCRNQECDGIERVWERDFKEGHSWHCQTCGARNVVMLGVAVEASEASSATIQRPGVAQPVR